MFLQILQITAPVFLLASAGYVWARLKMNFDLEFITRLAINFSMPCLIFSVLVKVEIDPTIFRDIALASVVAYAALAGVMWLGIRATGLGMRTYLAPGVFANTGNVGLPVALFAYGQQGLAFAIVIFAIMATFSFTIGIYMVAGRGRLSEVLKQPLVYASILGGVFALQGWGVPVWLLNSLDLAGQISIPLMRCRSFPGQAICIGGDSDPGGVAFRSDRRGPWRTGAAAHHACRRNQLSACRTLSRRARKSGWNRRCLDPDLGRGDPCCAGSSAVTKTCSRMGGFSGILLVMIKNEQWFSNLRPLAGAVMMALAVGSCSSSPSGPPSAQNDICSIFAERPDWREATLDSALRWGAPAEVQMAIIWAESSFRAEARPRKRYALGIIPWGRASSAYGYAQAIDGTWDWYRRETGNSGADRDDFDDAADFVGWYMAKTLVTNGVQMHDAFNHYIAYHDGHTGFKRGDWRGKSWLQKVATRVADQAVRYRGQLHRCS
jgi:hypothetical protein